MGQEAGKAAAWPKPSGGYQTITGRRYGRRHAYIGFRPTLESPNRISACQKSESEDLELSSVPKETDLSSTGNADLRLFHTANKLTSDSQEEKRTLDCNVGLSLFMEANGPVKDCQTFNNSTKCSGSSKTLVTHVPVKTQTRSYEKCIVAGDTDSFESKCSDVAEKVSFCEDICLKVDAIKNLEPVNNTVCELQRGSPGELLSEFSSGNHSSTEDSSSQGSATSLSKHSNQDLYTAPWSLSGSSVSEDEAMGFGSAELCESRQNKGTPGLIGGNTLQISSDISALTPKLDPINEPVVRPKIRKTCPPSGSSRKDPLIMDETGKDVKNCRKEKRDTWSHAPKSSRAEKSAQEADTVNVEAPQKKIKEAGNDNVNLEDSKPLVDDTFWDDFEVYGLKMFDSRNDEESSECSDGEWSTCLPPYFSSDRDHSSSDESWETLPGKEEHEVQSNSSSLEEENSDFCFQVEEQTSLEDGEIPWLQYHEDIESSTDDENEFENHYLPPGFFILDGNNNLEDDSSMSEDLEVEWRLLDDYGDGIGVAQAMSYMDPQFLTYMALEERLAQAMETALAHLESLAVDVEQAHPPATKESIDCLPQIVLTDDHLFVGQEQCCAICCSEYIKDEILTELPCHHLFHKPCVTLWLQKSGTCPVCRHVLTTEASDAAAATSFLSDHESPPSVHNAAGTR
ncbi:E3 ubiquitin-protein ligase Praja-2 [Gastrophryne carolinensis]